MINLRLVQVNFTSLYSIFIFDNFLDTPYLEHLTKVVEQKTNEDSLNKKFAVKANVSSFQEFLEDEDFLPLRIKILEHLNYCLLLRSPNPNCKVQYQYRDFWGMQHHQGDYTELHDHNMSNWSGSIYFRVPCDTEISFADLKYKELIRENSLYLFPSLMKHEVSPHTIKESRVSAAFNIVTNFINE